MRKSSIAVFLLAALTFSFWAPAASAQARHKVGNLTCRLAPSFGLIVGSFQNLSCRFTGPSRRAESYSGTATRFGLDLGVTAGGVMGWSVLARTRAIGRGGLAGRYVGASGDVSLGAGVGAKALIGGSRRTTMLQPLSLNARLGVNLAVGLTGLTLRYQG